MSTPRTSVLVVLIITVHTAIAAVRTPPFESRIVGGLVATDTDRLSYVVSLKIFGQHICGGSIIGERTILTAAHCLAFATPRLLQVHAGAHSHNMQEGTMVPVRSLYRHSGWTPETMDYDIGVVRLLWSLHFSDTISAIALPRTASGDLTQPRPGSMATVSGWGLTSIDGPESTILRFARVPIIEQAQCEDLMTDAITPRMMCAGYARGGIDACQQDSGGPLELDGQLVGIVSWGVGCALPDKPGVYTRVAALLPWLQKTVHDFYGNEI